MQGKKIYLKKLAEEKITHTYVEWLNDPLVNQYLETRWTDQSLDSVHDFVMRMNEKNDEFLFGIFDIEKHIHIGNIKIGPIHPHHSYADVSLFIGDKNYWGKGIAKEAIYLISKFGFEDLGIHKIKAGCYEPNKGSLNAFLACGYKVEGTHRSQYKSGATFVDGIQMGILKHELRIPE